MISSHAQYFGLLVLCGLLMFALANWSRNIFSSVIASLSASLVILFAVWIWMLGWWEPPQEVVGYVIRHPKELVLDWMGFSAFFLVLAVFGKPFRHK